jgi:type II secretory pathway pseudopilin PulG
MHLGEGIMKNEGASLIDLSVVAGIISILLAAAGFSYQGWMGGYKIEKTTKELYVDLMHARLMAIQTNRKHFALLDKFSYAIAEDTNDNDSYDAGDALLPEFPKPLEYELRDNGSGHRIDLDKRGLISQLRTLRVKSSGLDPDYNCLKVSRSRIIMGRYDNNDKNEVCVPK